MSIFNELLPKIIEISDAYTNKLNYELKAALESIDQLEEEFLNGRAPARGKSTKIVHLQSINEDEDETTKAPEDKPTNNTSSDRSSNESTGGRGSKKRSKHEVEGMESPEQEKRQKRNASVKAQSIISKQVNVNLSQKLRRGTLDKDKSRKGKEDKENTEPVPVVQIKQEKISLPSVPMEVSCIPDETLPPTIAVKQEVCKDEIAMPPPMAPVPKSRKVLQKEKSEDSTDDESTGRKRTTRTKKNTDTHTTDRQTASSRTTRASSRTTRQLDVEEAQLPETRPKRTRAKKVAEVEKEKPVPTENVSGSPAEKPRPKRTRRRKTASRDKQPEKPETTQSESEPEIISPRDKRVETEIQSPILQNNSIKCKPTKLKPYESKKTNYVTSDISNKNLINNESNKEAVDKLQVNKIKNLAATEQEINGNEKEKTKLKNADDIDNIDHKENSKKEKAMDKVNSNKELAADAVDNIGLDETRVLGQLNATVTISTDLDKSSVPPNGTYHHGSDTPKVTYAMNETVVLERNRETIVLDRPQANIMNTTVVLDRADLKATDLTDDNSILTDDSDALEATPPAKLPAAQPTSAVKEKVQQFEEMASRVTRTKTRAMAKKEEQPDEQTPPDKPPKAVLSSDTLAKMNSMIFNGKPPQVSTSASKQRPVPAPSRSLIPTTGPKVSVNKAREADDIRKEREDARKKKEAMLEAKREMQRKKREDKMAAAAAAREAAERERRVAIEAAARERLEKQAHADQGKLVRLKEVERKKQELARKAVETEERRKAEEQARQQRLADEQRRAEAARRKQLEEAEISKKEDALMQREIERKQKEFMERQRMKHRMDDKVTPHKTGSPYTAMPPVYMLDGFQYLNSDDDDDDDPPNMPIPMWSTSMARRGRLSVQARIPSLHIDKLFSVREHTPDLREIFPNIERMYLKRTSSAVWRTPPTRLPALKE